MNAEDRLNALAESMRKIRTDCTTDALALDHTPFTPRGIGEVLGSILAMIDAVAHACEVLAQRQP